MALTKIKVNNLDTSVTNMVQNMVTDNSVDSADVTLIVNSNIAAKSTSDLSEGTNLYYTDARADARADTRAQLKIDALVDAAPGSLDTLNELAAALGDDANFSTTITNSIAAKLPLAGGAITGNVTFGDNNKAIFGAGSDASLFSDGTQGSARGFILQSTDGTKDVLTFVDGGATNLFYNNSPKLATTSTGIDVTGTVTADGLTVADGDPTLTLTDTDGSTTTTLKTVGSNTELSNPSGGNLRFRTNASELERMRISPDGDISFYEDTGTTAKFFWDASAEKLGIGTTPNNKLTLSDGSTSYTGHGGGTYLEVVRGSGADAGIILNKDTGQWMMGIDNSDGTNPPLRFEYSAGGSAHAGLGNGTVGLTLNYQGKVGIGTSSPSEKLHVEGNARLADAGSIQFGSSKYQTLTGQAGSNDLLYRTYANHIFKTATGASDNTDGTERMRIDSSGNVGIGQTPSATSSYMVALQVGEQTNLYGHTDGTGAGSATYLSNNITHNSGEKYINSDSGSLYTQSSGSHKWFTYPSGTAGATATPSERMRINSSGLLEASHDAYDGMRRSLTLSNPRNAAGTGDGTSIYFNNTGTATIARSAYIGGVSEENYGQSNALVFGTSSGGSSPTERMRLDSSGNVGIGTTTPPSKLSIEGDGIAFRIDGTGNTSRGILFRNVGGSAEGFIQTDGSMHFLQEDAGKYIRFSTANTERMRINSSGRQSYNGNATAVAHGNFVGEVASSGYRALSFEHTVGGGEVGSIRTSSSTAVYYGDGSQLTGVGGSTNWSEVGTYMLGQEDLGNVTESHTIAGSNLRPAGFFGNTSGLLNDNSTGCNLTGGNTTQSGTWRRMSRSNNGGGDIHAGLYLRIS